MKIVLDIETVQASRLEWARNHGIELAFPPGASSRDQTDLFSYAEYEEQLHKENEQYERSAFEPVYDTMANWSNWDMRGWVKLDVLAKALNVGTKSGSGGQVAEMWANGKKKDVTEYCLQDTFVTYGCYSRLVFQRPHSREDVLRMPQYIHVD